MGKLTIEELAQRLDVHVDMARKAAENLLAKGLIEEAPPATFTVRDNSGRHIDRPAYTREQADDIVQFIRKHDPLSRPYVVENRKQPSDALDSTQGEMP